MTKRDGALITLAYLLWLVAANVINVLTTGAQSLPDVLRNWVRFDAIYFRVIAEHGYAEASNIIRVQQGFPFLTAEFPLFPLLIHLAVPFFSSDYTLATVLVPQVLTWLTLLALFHLTLLDFSRTAAYLTIAALLTFPVSYFLLAPYSETVFLLLTILTFDLYRRKRFVLSGIAGALAASARIVGAPLIMGAMGVEALWEWWARNRGNLEGIRGNQGNEHAPFGAASTHNGVLARDVFWRTPLPVVAISLVPLGALAYMAYQVWAFGNPLMFLRGHASSEWKVGFDLLGPARGLVLPFYTLFARDWGSDTFRTNLFNAAFLYLALVFLVYAWRQLPPTYNAYAALAILMPMFTGTLISMPRFLLISFPLFIGMGLWFEAHPRGRWMLVPLAAASLAATHLFFRTVFLG